MRYLSVPEVAERWGISAGSVRTYCALGRIEGAYLSGNTWNIPENAIRPEEIKRTGGKPSEILPLLIREKKVKRQSGFYDWLRTELTYHSTCLEGREADPEDTEKHLKCVDMMIDRADYELSERLIRQLYGTLKNGADQSAPVRSAMGKYKKSPNEFFGRQTVLPGDVAACMKKLLADYNAVEKKTADGLLDFHVRFMAIQPFQDDNGRIARLLLFKECLRNRIVPFIISKDLKRFYEDGLQNWAANPFLLRNTCRIAQERFQEKMDFHRITYK